jgi:hypothetical protein
MRRLLLDNRPTMQRCLCGQWADDWEFVKADRQLVECAGHECHGPDREERR